MTQLPSQQAKDVWDRHLGPSARSVARALTQAGRPVHFTTINRWRRQGWQTEPNEHPVAQARAALDSAIPLLTGGPTTTAEEFVRENSETEVHADRGESLFMVGASPENFARVKPRLEAMGTTIQHLRTGRHRHSDEHRQQLS